MNINNDQLNDILDNDEKILWQGKPTFIPFITSGVPTLVFGIIWGIMDYGFIQKTLGTTNSLNLTLIPFFLLHLLPLWIGILHMIGLFLVFNNTIYATTNKRIILRSGFWGIDFKSIDYDKIVDLRVDVNPIESMLNVGTIKINTSSMVIGNTNQIYDSISSISDPYKVFKEIKTVSVNVKTDWNYPNNLRPSENSGYKTKYKP